MNLTPYAKFLGMQEDGMGGSFELWNLTRPLAGHPVGSTVTRATIERAVNGAVRPKLSPRWVMTAARAYLPVMAK